MFTPSRKITLLLSLGLLLSALPCRATDGIYTKFGLDMGYAGRTARWSIYTFGSGTSDCHFSALEISSPSSYASPGQVTGNVALAGDYADVTLSGNGNLAGDIYLKPTGRIYKRDAAAWAGVSNTSSSTSLNSGVTSLKKVSASASILSPTSGMPSTLISGPGTNWVFNIGMTGTNTTAGNSRIYYVPSSSIGKLTLRLTDFVVSGGSQVTFNGLAGQSAVVNVSNNFNIGGASKVLLTGGLTPSDILFNVTGNNAGKTGALPTAITGDSIFNGMLLAYNSAGAQRSVAISGHNTEFTGELVANQALITSGAKVKKPKKGSE
jgi:hypothetical protein